MPALIPKSFDQDQRYRLRVLYCGIGALVLLIGIFKFWPLPGEPDYSKFIFHTDGQETIALEEIQPTRQSTKPPPPPPPMIPLVVPDDVVMDEEIEIVDAFLTLEEYGVDTDLTESPIDGAANSAQAPEIGPKPLRFVEPEYTRAARRKNVKAEVVIEVLIDERGIVQEAKVLERFLYDTANMKKTVVPSLNYGLEESALSAAQRWTFQPARQNGTAIRSYTTLTFSFGV